MGQYSRANLQTGAVLSRVKRSSQTITTALAHRTADIARGTVHTQTRELQSRIGVTQTPTGAAAVAATRYAVYEERRHPFMAPAAQAALRELDTIAARERL